MATGVVVQVAPGGAPRGSPVITRVAVSQVEEAPPNVGRRIVVAIADQAPEAGVSIERVAAARVRDDPEVILTAQVVDPR
jgi:hypothetical protein